MLAALVFALAAQPLMVIRVNQVGYLPDAPKVAVLCALGPISSAPTVRFVVRDTRDHIVVPAKTVPPAGTFGPCAQTWRLDFSTLRASGSYVIDAGGIRSPRVRIAPDVYDGGADTALYYMRQQRSGFNPFFKDSVHQLDGYVVDDTGRVVKFHPASGGWADASDYLQYVATSATATYHMLMAYRDHRSAFADAFLANGLAGANGVPDVVDEARHGLAWLLRMFPSDSELYNQLGDDRDHAYLDLPTTDSSDYGWGKGKQRPIYACTSRPQGLFQGKNRSTGLASTAAKYASAFALAARMKVSGSDSLDAVLRRKAVAAFALGERYPGVCQTAPGRSPYFYEEENWVDDMELAAAELHALTGEARYLVAARAYADREPVTPWMGADTARHYEWYPWHNAGHFSLWRTGAASDRATAARYYRDGVAAVAARATNGFRIGIPFIWCSNDLMVSFATQALLYRRMTGDARFREFEQAAIDWLFGANPWGTSMVVGYPRSGRWPRDPHSVVSMQFGAEALTGGLVDGPVYRSIFSNLRGVALRKPDADSAFNTGFIVYHDDVGDYSTNEPIMDGTASLAYLLSALSSQRSGKR
ncbi:MAG TPA: glycoside hydrolase family 9 protein [Gemmatimonadaceae bacterium]